MAKKKFTGSNVYFQDKFDEYDFGTRYNMMSPKEGWDQMIQDYINSTKMEEGELGKLPPIPLSVLRSGLGYILKQLAGGKFNEGRRDFLEKIVKPKEKIKLDNPKEFKFDFKGIDELKKKLLNKIYMNKNRTLHAEGGRVPLKDGSKKGKAVTDLLNQGYRLSQILPLLGSPELIDLIKSLPFEKGGRVELWQGGLAAALRFLMQKYGKDVVKLAKDAKPSKKWDTLKAIKRFEKKYPIKKAEGGLARMLGE